MIYTKFAKLLFSCCFTTFLGLLSCQKGVNPAELDPIPEEVKDSTLLIKSISLRYFDPSSGLPVDDSIKEVYTYDTVNRKIILTVDQAASSLYVTGAGVEHTYNANGLLIDLVYKYENGFIPSDDEMVSVKLDYDAGKVLQKIAINYFSGDTKIVLLKKALLLSGKYQLSWTEPLLISKPSSGDTANVRATFDEGGNCLKSEFSYSYETIVGAGEEAYTKIIMTDTMYYDAKGSVNKVVSTYVDTLLHENETFTACEFNSRESKGDQLYNMKQVLLNGIANIPFGHDLFRGGASGLLSYFQTGFEPMEYSLYPFQIAKVYNSQTKQYDSFMAVSEFDSKERLIKFKGFLNDFELIPYQYEITYYK
jgi:hypothetical protein